MLVTARHALQLHAALSDVFTAGAMAYLDVVPTMCEHTVQQLRIAAAEARATDEISQKQFKC